MEGNPTIYKLKEEYFQICQDYRNWGRMYKIVETMEKMKKIPGTEMESFKLCQSHLRSVASKCLQWT